MYAVIKSGGKQYKVKKGDILRVERIDSEPGDSVGLSDVLMLVDGDKVDIGKPFLEGASVIATVDHHGRGPKIRIVKFRRRKHHRKQMGHRQAYTALSVTDITAG